MANVEVLVPLSTDAGPNTMTGAGSHFARVDEDPHDGDTTFLAHAGGTQSEAFGLNSLSVIPKGSAVVSVRIRVVIKGTDGGVTATLKFGYRFGGVDYWGANRNASFPSYGAHQDIYTLNQGTGGAFEEHLLRSPTLFAIRAEWVVPLTFEVPTPRMTQCVLFATIPDPAAPLTDLETAEFWRIHRLVRLCILDLDHSASRLVDRYLYLRNRANLNGQDMKPPREFIEADYLPGLFRAKRRFR